MRPNAGRQTREKKAPPSQTQSPSVPKYVGKRRSRPKRKACAWPFFPCTESPNQLIRARLCSPRSMHPEEGSSRNLTLAPTREQARAAVPALAPHFTNRASSIGSWSSSQSKARQCNAMQCSSISLHPARRARVLRGALPVKVGRHADAKRRLEHIR
jgi:hypothetical protein